MMLTVQKKMKQPSCIAGFPTIQDERNWITKLIGTRCSHCQKVGV